jgi:hypothetical protein
MAAGGSRYFQSTPIRRRDIGEDVQRGISAGETVGKLLSNLGTAIQGMQKNALANKLMNTEDAPRASLVSPGGQWQTAGGDSGGGDNSNTAGPTQDLGQLPPQQDTTFTNPATGNIEPLQGQSDPDAELAKAMAEARLQSGSTAPTVGSLPGAGGSGPAPSDQDLLNAMNAPPASSTSTPSTPSPTVNGKVWVPNAPIDPSKVPTAGTAPHTGGTMEMDLQKEILAQQIQKASLASDKARLADLQAEQSGTGRFALDAAIKKATLAHTQAEIAALQNKPAKEVKDPPAANIDSEPVIDQGQLNRHINNLYGNGAAEGMVAALNEPDMVPDPAPDPKNKTPNPMVPNPNKPVINGNMVTLMIKGKPMHIPLQEAQIYTKQLNALRLKNGLPAYTVPGEDQTLGLANNPYIAKNNLDVFSRAPADANGNGGWVRLPSGGLTHLKRLPDGRIVGMKD